MRSAVDPGLEASRLSPYHGFLFVLLSTATLFEGFDASMMGFAAPDVRASLDISRSEWGTVFSITRLGMVASFFFLLFADRFGRRNLMMLTVLGFALCTGLTTLAQNKVEFIVYQTLARLFLTAEYALAIIMVGEEFPARLRGRAIAILTSLATVGVVVMAKVQPYVLLEEGAPGNWLHDGGVAAVVWVQQLFGQPVDGADWRAIYLLGLAPLVLVFGLRFGMRETRRFEASKAAQRTRSGWRQELREHLLNATTPFRGRYRRRTAIVTLLWNCVHLVTAPAVAYWVIYAREDLDFTPSVVGNIIFWAYVMGIAGNFVAGFLIDRLGRKWTCSGFYILAAIAIVGLFQTQTMVGQYLWHMATVFCFASAITATHVYASELFPTEIRATGYGWTTNLFGRATEVFAPAVIGLFIPVLGISWAVSLVAFGPIAGALLVLWYAPETKGLTLEEIQLQLEGAPAVAPERVRAAAGG
jgi:putative MFS transporter